MIPLRKLNSMFHTILFTSRSDYTDTHFMTLIGPCVPFSCVTPCEDMTKAGFPLGDFSRAEQFFLTAKNSSKRVCIFHYTSDYLDQFLFEVVWLET